MVSSHMLLSGFLLLAASLGEASEWYHVSVQNPLFVTSAQLHHADDDYAEIFSSYQKAAYKESSPTEQAAYDFSGDRLGLAVQAPLKKSRAAAGLLMLRDGLKGEIVEKRRQNAAELVSEAVREKRELTFSPFLIGRIMDTWTYSLTLESKDYTVSDHRSYKIEGETVLRTRMPEFKQSYKRILPGVMWQSASWLVAAEGEPAVKLKQATGQILLPSVVRLAVQNRFTDTLRLDGMARHSKWDEIYTSDKSRWELTCGASHRSALGLTSSAYISYSPAYARHSEDLGIDNLQDVGVTILIDYAMGPAVEAGVMYVHNQGQGWKEISSDSGVQHTDFSARRDEAGLKVSIWF
jgi:hypothetical protein